MVWVKTTVQIHLAIINPSHEKRCRVLPTPSGQIRRKSATHILSITNASWYSRGFVTARFICTLSCLCSSQATIRRDGKSVYTYQVRLFRTRVWTRNLVTRYGTEECTRYVVFQLDGSGLEMARCHPYCLLMLLDFS